jgi:phosphonate transport system substrate-binding protein
MAPQQPPVELPADPELGETLLAPPGETPAATPPADAAPVTQSPDPRAPQILEETPPPQAEGAASPTQDSAASPEEPPTAEPAAPSVEPPPEPLRFGVLAGRRVATTIRILAPVAEEMQERLGRRVEILPMASYDAMIGAQEQRRIDGGFYSAAAFTMADTRCRCLEPIVAPRAEDGTLAYHAIIVTRNTSGIRTPADLAGRTVAVGESDSLGSYRMQLAGLMGEGLDPAALFGGIRLAGSAEDAVRLVLSGGADVAFAWSTLSGSVERGYSRGTLTRLVATGELTMRELAIVWGSDPIAHGPFAVARTVPDAQKATLEAYLLELEGVDPPAYDLLNPFYGGGYAAVDAEDYRGLRALAVQDVDALQLRETSARAPRYAE